MRKTITAFMNLVRKGTFLQEAILVLLLGAYLLLLAEVRFEHKLVVMDKWQAWIPIGYFALMCIVIPVGMLRLRRNFGKALLVTGFGAALIIGTLGTWFHTKGEPFSKVVTLIKTDLSAPGHLSTEEEGPPPLAPLALVGLAIGVLVSLWEPGYTGPANANANEKY